MNAAVPINGITPVGPGRFASADITEPDVVLQTGGQAEPSPHPISQLIRQAAEEGIPPIIEDTSALAFEDSSTFPVQEFIPPVSDDPIAPADTVPNLLPTGGPAHLPVEELTPFVVKGPAAPADESPGPSVTENQRPFVAESTSLVALVPTQGPKPLPHLHVADAMADISNVPCALGNPGIVQHTTSPTRQDRDEEQDEEDALIVNALLAVNQDFDTTSDLRGAVELDNTPQEKDGGSVQIPAPNEVTAGPTETALGLAPGLRNLSTDTHSSSTTRPSQQSPDVLLEMSMEDVPMVQESATHPLNPCFVLEGHPPRGDTTVTGLGSLAFRFCTRQQVSPFVRCSSHINNY